MSIRPSKHRVEIISIVTPSSQDNDHPRKQHDTPPSEPKAVRRPRSRIILLIRHTSEDEWMPESERESAPAPKRSQSQKTEAVSGKASKTTAGQSKVQKPKQHRARETSPVPPPSPQWSEFNYLYEADRADIPTARSPVSQDISQPRGHRQATPSPPRESIWPWLDQMDKYLEHHEEDREDCYGECEYSLSAAPEIPVQYKGCEQAVHPGSPYDSLYSRGFEPNSFRFPSIKTYDREGHDTGYEVVGQHTAAMTSEESDHQMPQPASRADLQPFLGEDTAGVYSKTHTHPMTHT